MKFKSLAECTARLDEIKAQLAEEQDADALRALFTEQAEVETQAAEFSEDNGDGDAPGIDAVEFKAMNERMAEMETQLADSQERERQARIDNKVDKLRIPVLRDHVTALYDLATKATTKVRFFISEDKGEKKYGEVDAFTVIDDLVARLNKSTEQLFTQLGHSGELKRDDEPAPSTGTDAGAELDRLTRAHMAKHNEADYQVAWHAILTDPENAELKRQYSEG